MPPDPRELVDRLDALAAQYAERPLHDDYMRFAHALTAAYPALRAAVLRCAKMEARAWRYEKALRAIGYEPMGLPEASDRQVLSWFHNLLDEAQRLSREATALRQQRDTLREALRGLAGAYGVEFRKEGYVMLRVEEAALRRVDAALAQCDTQEGV